MVTKKEEVVVGDITKIVVFGDNWYGSNNGGNVCPFLTTGYLHFELSTSNLGVVASFYNQENVIATGLPSFNVLLKLNGNSMYANVNKGTATAQFPSSDYKAHNNVVTAQAPFPPTYIMNLPDDIVKSILAAIASSSTQNNGSDVKKGGTKGGSDGGSKGGSDSE